MTTERTTIVLGRKERAAARGLADRWGVTPSEAIRRALMQVAESEWGELRRRRARHRATALNRLIKLSKGMNVAAELERLGDDRDNW